MRVATILLLMAGALPAQFKSTVPLVVAPTTVTDGSGNFVDGLTAGDLVFFDNSVPQAIQVDAFTNPMSVVVVIQASSNSAAILDKLRGSGLLFADLLAGEGGETAVISSSEQVRVAQDFTSDAGRLKGVLRNLRVEGDGAAILDGVWEALRILGTRDKTRRKVILAVAERRDRSSGVKSEDLLRELERQNASIYWLTYSTLMTPFTARPKRVWDRMTDEEKNRPERMQGKIKYPWPDEEKAVPPDTAPGSLISIFAELKQRAKVDSASLLARTTGGRTFSFLKQRGLENAIQAVAEEVHRQYIVSFQPKGDGGGFHEIRAEVRGRPDLQVRTRAGYWAIR
ncbi:MAG: VWA domain-containing protein [Acidobacteria bacterium]|nr:VWA domain-containing protein [Acidobacteriota bacterium]